MILGQTLLDDHFARSKDIDFSGTHVVINNSLLKKPLQNTLIQAVEADSRLSGFLGLQSHTLKSLASQTPVQLEQNVINDKERLYLLSNIVKDHPKLLREANPIQLAQDLLHLFDELYLHSIELTSDKDELLKILESAYLQDTKLSFQSINNEAEIVSVLWGAWQEELQNRQLIDEKKLYAYQLAEQVKNTNKDQHWYLVFLSDSFSNIEYKWIEKLAEQSNVHIIAPKLATSNKAQFYKHALFNDEANKLNPLNHEELGLINCKSLEDEAKQVVEQLRYFYYHKQAHENISLLCEDRTLVRRIRALLDLEGIVLVDPFGWSLITTRAASFLNALLECAELDFPYDAVLELLKSPFLKNILSEESTYRFEHDIIRYENIKSDIDAYIRAINKRSKLLGEWTIEEKQKLESALNIIKDAVSPLTKIMKQKHFVADDFTQTILSSFKTLKCEELLEENESGKILLELLSDMLKVSNKFNFSFSLSDYKTWLTFELQSYFIITTERSEDIRLINLKQSQGYSCDYLVISAATQKTLPNISNNLQFFNQNVCKELGITSFNEKIASYKQWFFELLVRSKKSIITWQSEKDGNTQVASNWVTAITNSASKQFNEDLKDLRNEIKRDDIPQAHFKPAQAVEFIENYQHLLPDDISVSAHQDLINCPYGFFIGRILGLKSTDEIKDKLQKNDYGTLIHDCLEAFHTNKDHRPGPFTLNLHEANKAKAIELLTEITHSVFTPHIKHNYEDTAWLNDWLYIIPHYIDWEIKNQGQWKHKSSETKFSHSFSSNISLSGKIDRVDENPNKEYHRLIDYKTGKLPKKGDIETGENIQLTSYSIFLDSVIDVMYLSIDEEMKQVTIAHKFDDSESKGVDLHELRDATRERLDLMLNALKSGQGIPTWPKQKKCQHCYIAGICRK